MEHGLYSLAAGNTLIDRASRGPDSTEEVTGEALAVLKKHSFDLSYRGLTDNFVIAVPLAGRLTDFEAAFGPLLLQISEFPVQAEFEGLACSRCLDLRLLLRG